MHRFGLHPKVTSRNIQSCSGSSDSRINFFLNCRCFVSPEFFMYSDFKMIKATNTMGGILLWCLVTSLIAGTVGDPVEVCQARNQSYNIADSKQCDKYHQCTTATKLLPRLCDDGFVFSKEIHLCDYPHNVNCSGREQLQEPKTIGDPHCPRLNGFYEFPPSESCQKFFHCLEGKAYEKTCPDGVIFDPTKGACIHPDLSHRADCAAKTVLNFTCPNAGKKFVRLRFGDHDRLPHITNCRKFFICLADGKPRVGGCPLGKVFNPKLGVCDSPKRVPQCKDYYGKKDPAKLAKLAELGEEGSLNDDFESDITDEEGHSNEDDDEQENQTTHQNANSNKGKKLHSKRDTSPHVPVNPLTKPDNKKGSQSPSQASKPNPSHKSQSDNESRPSDEDSDD